MTTEEYLESLRCIGNGHFHSTNFFKRKMCFLGCVDCDFRKEVGNELFKDTRLDVMKAGTYILLGAEE